MTGRPRPDLPPGTDLLPQIRHIVVLMMENHSFDNYLAALYPNDIPSSLHHLPSTGQSAGVPTQTWSACHRRYAEGACDGFEPAAMRYWDEKDLPFYYGLARTFPRAERWFSSCLGPTFPNRRFLISGTAHGLMDDMPWDLIDYPEAGTIFDMLSEHDISWINYHSVRPATMLFKRMLGARGAVRDAAAESPLDALDLAATPAFATPPKLPAPALSWGSWLPHVASAAGGGRLARLAGSRPAST